MDNTALLALLIRKYTDNTLLPEERGRLAQLLEEEGSDVVIEAALKDSYADSEAGMGWDDAFRQSFVKDMVSNVVRSGSGGAVVIPRAGFLRRWWWAAASLALAFAWGAYMWISRPHDAGQVADAPNEADIAPGRNGAVLTLADGRTVVLDSMGNGIVAAQSGTSVVLRDGQLLYEAGAPDREALFNTMSTPKGRQFGLVLPDGTRVWLNSASSITYPTVFGGKERSVSVTGEAYFEVTKAAAQPFLVTLPNSMQVEVLGTHFNVNAYDNEPATHTTLLEGSVKVTTGKKSIVIIPGQQAKLHPSGNIDIVEDADIAKVMAWKNGIFNFEGASLEEVMRQLERWYDITVEYRGGIPQKTYKGKLSRDLTLQQLLKILQALNLRMEVEGRKLIVTP